MRGMLYRELCLRKRAYIINLFALLFFMILGILCMVSLRCGNLKQFSATAKPVLYYIFTYAAELVVILVLCADCGVIASDYKCKWNRFGYTLPLSEKEIAGEKFLFLGISFVIGVILSIIYAAIIGALADRPMDLKVFGNMMLVAAFSLVISMVQIPMLFKYKTSGAVSARITLFFSVIYAVLVLSAMRFISKHKAENDDELIEKYVVPLFNKVKGMLGELRLIFVFAALAAAVISWFLAVKALKRREK